MKPLQNEVLGWDGVNWNTFFTPNPAGSSATDVNTLSLVACNSGGFASLSLVSSCQPRFADHAVPSVASSRMILARSSAWSGGSRRVSAATRRRSVFLSSSSSTAASHFLRASRISSRTMAASAPPSSSTFGAASASKPMRGDGTN